MVSISFDLVGFIMSIARFGEDGYMLAVLIGWMIYFSRFHTRNHEIAHVKTAIRLGCTGHKVILYNKDSNDEYIYHDIPIILTCKKSHKSGKAVYSPREDLSRFEKFTISRAGFRYDLKVIALFWLTIEIAFFPVWVYPCHVGYTVFSIIFSLLSFGYIGIQYFIKGTDLYKMRCYRAFVKRTERIIRFQLRRENRRKQKEFDKFVNIFNENKQEDSAILSNACGWCKNSSEL